MSSYLDTGYLLVYAATGHDHTRQVVDLVLKEFRRLKNETISGQEIRDAKDHLKGSLMLSLESTSSRMSNLAKQDIYFGHQFTMEDLLKGIESVSAEDLQALANRLFNSSGCTLAALGKLSNLRITRGDLEF